MVYRPLQYLRLGKQRFSVVRDILRHPLNRGTAAKTLFDYASWNLARKAMNHKVVLQMPNDLQIIVPNQSNFATGLYLHQLYDFNNMAFFCHVLRADDLLLDIGANVGVYGLLSAKSTGCRVIACEPAPDTFRTLSDNVRLNRLDDLVELHNVAVGDSTGEIRLSVGQHGLNHVVSGEGTVVAQRRLDDIIGNRTPSAMKLDVEGYEMHVLRGAPDMLANPAFKVIMVEINGLIERYGETVEGIRAHLRAHGFAPVAYDPGERALNPGGAHDEMFVRDCDFIAARARDAKPFSLFGKDY
ncbi:FkbM family methyltransferase [Tardiphaga alba]|uniref:FkbM family methyltransferase n=1 Tax=Tardiphaga alba TaxID=340268 RepID=A0ABX8A9M0_9BRAD|nr:FkbM family methyltransferase [Tardiphaga alba]QUS39138.1 FkbM family methyltransferase [Tardiphaga alba]